MACGRKFKSRKTARKHKCPKSKVVRVPEEQAAVEEVSRPPPSATPNKPVAPPTPHAPPAPSTSYSSYTPSVTGELAIANLHSATREALARAHPDWEPWQVELETKRTLGILYRGAPGSVPMDTDTTLSP